MSKSHEWPSEVPTTGTVINEIEARFKAVRKQSGSLILVTREQLDGWKECVIQCAALLDPDNPPLTKEQLSRFKRK